MMTQRIKELVANKDSIQAEFGTYSIRTQEAWDELSDFMAEHANTIIQEHEALLRFVRKVRKIQIGPDEYYESSLLADASSEFGRALKALDKELKG